MNSFLLILTSIIFFAVPFLNFNLFLLSWFFFIPILYLLEKNRISPVKLGIIFGTISLLTVTYWATPTLVRLTGVSSLISFLTHLLYCLYESIFYILIFVLTSFSIKKVNNKWHRYLLIILFFIIIEQNFPRIFPYKIGNTQILFSEFSQLISYFGINFISFLVLLINIGLYEFLFKKNKKEPSLIVAIILLSFIAGQYLEENNDLYNHTEEPVKLALIQPVTSLDKINQIQKEINEKHKNLYLSIWPESSLDKVVLLQKNDYKKFQETFSKKFIFESKYLLFGTIVRNKSGYYNSAILLNNESEIQNIYSKNKLMIFGEFYPLKKIISKIVPIYQEFRELRRGEIKPLILESKTILGILICYEDLFEINSIKLTKNNSQLLINITNDSWYGDTLASYQHLMLAIPRSIENQKFLVRSTYNGITAVISPKGKILKKINKNQSGYLIYEINLLEKKSFYVKNHFIINLIYYLILGLCIILFFKKNSNTRF